MKELIFEEKKPKMRKSYSLPISLVNAIKSIAEKYGRSESFIVESLIEDSLKKTNKTSE